MATKKVKKQKNVLIISASFRPDSNSHALCQEVARLDEKIKLVQGLMMVL